VEDFFSVMEVFVMSSEEEGLGSSVLDAFVYKVPLVSTTAGGLKDLGRDGRGIMCAPKDAKAIAAGIDKVLNDQQFAGEMTEKACNYVVIQHAMKHISGQYLELMKP